jgi:hypothetical protein
LAEAQFNLGIMYMNGQGVAQDDTEAVRWFRKAADQSDGLAELNLGVMYMHGQGVAQDKFFAYMRLSLAAAQGFVYARNARDELAADMTPDQIAEAQRLERTVAPSLRGQPQNGYKVEQVRRQLEAVPWATPRR